MKEQIGRGTEPTALPMVWKLQDAVARLPVSGGVRFLKLFERYGLEMEIYAPRDEDKQTPHDRDEIYVVAAGHGQFFNGTERSSFGPGDFLFVPAHVEHRFEQFSSDLAVWVIFWGPRS